MVVLQAAQKGPNDGEAVAVVGVLTATRKTDLALRLALVWDASIQSVSARVKQPLARY